MVLAFPLAQAHFSNLSSMKSIPAINPVPITPISTILTTTLASQPAPPL